MNVSVNACVHPEAASPSPIDSQTPHHSIHASPSTSTSTNTSASTSGLVPASPGASSIIHHNNINALYPVSIYLDHHTCSAMHHASVLCDEERHPTHCI
mmetsp:Transcript_19990/g.55607  ORF Transcript_19990/g.55607 Transcript_19990/m.55607 type:complete len:99 (+) Transcript_19990:686-982(+)